jgi:hypothetical protein
MMRALFICMLAVTTVDAQTTNLDSEDITRIPLEKLAGFFPPEDLLGFAAKQNEESEGEADKHRALPVLVDSTWPEVDFTKMGDVTPVRFQGACGDCVAFGTVAAFESAYAIAHRQKLIHASEQELLSCSGAGSCSGGNWAFGYIKARGLPSIDDFPFTGNDETACKSDIEHPYWAINWGFVSSTNTVPAVSEIKQAILSRP